MQVVATVVAFSAIFVGVTWYRKDVLILGSWWAYAPHWLTTVAVSSSHFLGMYTKLNASRIAFENAGMRPNKDDLDHVNIEDIYVNHVAVRVYRPKSLVNSKKPPAVIYMHGGGFIAGSIASHNGFCCRLSRIAEVVVFSIEYRKAPEYIFPTAVNDCYVTTISIVNNAATYTIDPARIILMGDSAGGNLAAAVSQQVATLKQSCVQFAFSAQVLIYPTLQFFDFSLPSFHLVPHGRVTKERMAMFWSVYISGTADLTVTLLSGNHSRHLTGTRYQGYLQSVRSDVSNTNTSETVPEHVRKALIDPRACPLLADDLSDNPPTLIVTADHDVLRDDSLLYSVRLKGANVKVTHNSYPAPHGFLYLDYDSYFADATARQAFYDIVSFVKDVFNQESLL